VQRLPKSKSSGWILPDDITEQLAMEISTLAVGYIYSLVIEVPISIVADTIMLPIDLRRLKTFNSGAVVFDRALFGDGWPVKAEILKTHYHYQNCDPLIRRFLQNPGTPNHYDKILCLIDAGVGLAYIAGYDALDNEMAVARHSATTPETLDRIAKRGFKQVNRVIADNPSISALTIELMAAISLADPEFDAALSANPATPPTILHRIIEDVSHPLIGKYILRDVSRHPAASHETLKLLLNKCDELEHHPAAFNAKDVIEEARQTASTRLNQ
jgi:hypothetical protein